jgi:hypothetical protein
MTTPAQAVQVEEPGESTGNSGERAEGYNMLVATIPPGTLGRIRREVRAETFPNSETERETIAAVDEEVFDRVRPVEQRMIARASAFLDTQSSKARTTNGESADNALARAETQLHELYTIQEELAAGRPTGPLVERYRKVRDSFAGTIAPTLLRLAGEAARLKTDLDDPFATTERILSRLPRANWRPVIGRY